MNLKKPLLLLFFFLSIFLLFFYSKIIFNPNSYLFTAQGDGIKNYYVFNNYIRNSNSILNFDQMNYPYGESVFFIDNSPFISIQLKLISKIFPPIADYSIAIMNLLILLNFYLASWVLFKLFKHLKIKKQLAILATLGIVLLSPQVLRINGHFTLSYSFFILFTLYYIIKYRFNKKNIPQLLLLSLILLIAFFTHAYLGLVCAGILILYSILLFFNNLINKELKSDFLWGILIGLIPLGIFYITSKTLDIHTGRTTNPFGIFEYYADLETVFLPAYGLLNPLKEALFSGIIQKREGLSYVGLPSIIMTLLLLIAVLTKFLFKRNSFSKTVLIQNTELKILFFVSILFLCLSMLYPFRWNMHWLMDYFSFIKQFRSVGRFSWVFYYLISIVSIYTLNKVINSLIAKNRKTFAYILLTIIPTFLIAESIGNHNFVSNKQPIEKNCFNYSEFDEGLKNAIFEAKKKDYQAFIPIPYFHLGSENFELFRFEFDNIFALQFNSETKIPMFANMSGRTSIWESKNNIQLFSSNFYKKEIISDLPNEKPILVIFQKSNIRKQERMLINRTTKLYEDDKWYLGEIEFSKFFHVTDNDEVSFYFKHKPNLFKRDGFLVNDSSRYFRFNDLGYPQNLSFETNENSLELGNNFTSLIGTIKGGELELGKEYVVSFWVYNNGDNFGEDMTKGIVFFDKVYDNSSHWLPPHFKPSTSLEINKNWTLVELKHVPELPIADHLLIYSKPFLTNKKTYIKDLLIYEKGMMIYKELGVNGKNYLLKNNHRINF